MGAEAGAGAAADYRGWLAGLLIFAVILVGAAGLWVRYHG